MPEHPFEPKEYDAVLGGQTLAPAGSAVLGGLAGVKHRLASDNCNCRIAALSEALKYGNAGLDLLLAALDDEVQQVRNAACLLLGKSEQILLLEKGVSIWNKWRVHSSRMEGCTINLSGVNLSKFDLRKFNLSEVNLNRCELVQVDLSGAFLRAAKLSKTNLSWANLSGAYLSWAYLYKANLSEVNLQGACLFGANLNGANLNRADLRGAYLYNANLKGTDFTGAIMPDGTVFYEI
jgi:uncharacterized protein YjbI with pentapeptide repeats